MHMSRARKRRIRLVAALGAAIMLAGALVFTSFSAATETTTPSQVISGAEAGRSYEITGKVADGSVRRSGDRLSFDLRDRAGTASVPVRYSGIVPDPFREGREVIVSGEMRGGVFVAERDSLITKCPSKFSKEPAGRQR
jgi:cytochrome c-type biogenesis protein CcmE